MEQISDKTYQHKDFYLCAFLIVKNCELIKHERIDHSTTFSFKDTPELRQHVKDFYGMKSTVEPMAYSGTIRNLKTMIHANR